MNPYKIIEATEHTVTYEYRTIYTLILYGSLGLALVGYFSKQEIILHLVGISIFILFAFKLILGRTASKEIKNALRDGMVEFNGSKHSFKNPIRIKIPRKVEQATSRNSDKPDSLNETPRLKDRGI